jgi:hypothetical protein
MGAPRSDLSNSVSPLLRAERAKLLSPRGPGLAAGGRCATGGRNFSKRGPVDTGTPGKLERSALLDRVLNSLRTVHGPIV